MDVQNCSQFFHYQNGTDEYKSSESMRKVLLQVLTPTELLLRQKEIKALYMMSLQIVVRDTVLKNMDKLKKPKSVEVESLYSM